MRVIQTIYRINEWLSLWHFSFLLVSRLTSEQITMSLHDLGTNFFASKPFELNFNVVSNAQTEKLNTFFGEFDSQVNKSWRPDFIVFRHEITYKLTWVSSGKRKSLQKTKVNLSRIFVIISISCLPWDIVSQNELNFTIMEVFRRNSKNGN